MKTVYLGGPINGCTEREAKNWRAYVMEKISEFGIRGISPLRCEPISGERYGLGTADPKFGTSRAIASKNLFDVRSCDLTLCYIPMVKPPNHISYGTLGELFWAHAESKPTILVTDDPDLQKHPVVQAAAGWSLETLDDAIEVITGILYDYTPTKKYGSV